MAIIYIIAIHIQIALLSLFVPMFKLPTLLLPIHVMLLEILIDPTSSIIFQRIKPSKDIMKEQPRNINESIINLKTVISSISKGFLIFLVVFITYFVLISKLKDTSLAITIAYLILVLSIMLITYQLKDNEFILKAFIKSFKDKVSLVINLGVVIGLVAIVYIPVFNRVANTTSLEFKWWILIVFLVFIAILSFDIFKFIKKKVK